MSNASNLSTLANVLDDGSDGQFLKSTGSGGVAFDTVAAGAVVYATADLLPLSGFAAGDMAYVTATNRFYINNGSGWYSVSLVNTNPNITSVQDAGSNTTPFTLATDQTATVVTVTAADPEDVPLTYGYSVTTGDASLNGSTVVQGTGSNSNVFTVTPHASQDATFTITFTASDGINQATSANAFSLSFVTIVADSNHTTLLATATSTGGNSTIEDSSSANSGSGHSITVNGDAYAGTFSPYRSGGYSVHLDDGEEISFPDSSNYNLSNGSFSIEAWVYPTSYDSPWSGVISQFSSSSRGWGLAFSSTQITFLGSTNGGSSTNVNGSVTSSVPLNQWTHLLVTRDSNTIRIFNNGVLVNNFTESGTFNNSTNPLRIGELNSAASENFRGYIKDARVVKGSVPTEYQTSSTTNSTTIFSVPSEPLTAVTDTVLLTCHLPYISDGSTNNATPTLSGDVSTKPLSPYDYSEYAAADHGGSLTFNGTNSAVEISDNDDFDFGTGDLTIECWVYPEATSNNYPGFLGTSAGWGSVAASGFRFDNLGDSKFQMSWYGPGDPFLETQSTYKHNRWYHFVVTRTGGSTWRMFVNGILEDTGTNSTAYDISIGGNNLQVGGKTWDGGNGWFKGNVADLRLTKGSVVSEYQTTSTTVGTKIFTPRTSPISSSGSELHIKGTDASIIDKSQGANLRLEGNTTGSTTTNFTGAKSIYIDGPNGDYISLPASDNYKLGTGDFTLETWVKVLLVSNDSGRRRLFNQVDTASSTTGQLELMVYPDGYIYVRSGSNIFATTTDFSDGSWYHLALVRHNSVLKVYVDGSLENSANNTTDFSPSAISPIIGRASSTASNSRFQGYIQDFRISKGKAHYTANFTPPSAPLEG